jgi:hypothetical protein
VAADKAFEAKVRQFRRTQALDILLAFVNNRQLHETHPAQKLALFNKTLAALLPQLEAKEAARAKPRHLLSLFAILRGLKQHSGTELDWSAVRARLTPYCQAFQLSRQPPPVKKSFKKLLAFLELKVSPVSRISDTAETAVVAVDAAAPAGEAEAEGEGESKAEKKKKKKKNKQSLQRKKEAKAKAAAAQAEEGVPSFADFVVDSTEVYVPAEKKKNKFKQRNKNKKRKNSESAPEQTKVKKSKS